MYPTYISPANRLKKLRNRLEELRPLYDGNRGYFPGRMPNGSPANAWLQTKEFDNIEIAGSGFTADLPEGWSADVPFNAIGSSFDIYIRMSRGGRIALTIRVELDREGRISEATIPSGEYWSANQRPRSYAYTTVHQDPSYWPRVVLIAMLVAWSLGIGLLGVQNRVTFDRAEQQISEILEAKEVELIDHSENRFLVGDPYEVTFNVTADGKTVSVHCQDGIFKSLFCSKRDSS